MAVSSCLTLSGIDSAALQFLELVLSLDQLMNLINKVGLGLGDNSLDFVDLLIDNLVDVLHVVEHLVSLVIQGVKLHLIVLQLDLATVHLLARIVLLSLRVDALKNLTLV